MHLNEQRPVDYYPLADRPQRRRSAWDPWPELIELAVIGTYKGVVWVLGWVKGKVSK
jgi:hypothetical protein